MLSLKHLSEGVRSLNRTEGWTSGKKIIINMWLLVEAMVFKVAAVRLPELKEEKA